MDLQKQVTFLRNCVQHLIAGTYSIDAKKLDVQSLVFEIERLKQLGEEERLAAENAKTKNEHEMGKLAQRLEAKRIECQHMNLRRPGTK